MVNNKNKQPLLDRPDFIPEFTQWEKFKDTVIGITGHRGVLGSIIFKRFCKAGVNVEAYQGDILDVGSLTSWFGKRQFSHFFHFAAFVPVAETEKNPLKAFEVNAIGNFNLCKQIKSTQRNCWSFFASSSHIYKPSGVCPAASLTIHSEAAPGSAYGKSKYVGDLMVQYLLDKRDISYCVGRIFSFTHWEQEEPYLIPTLTNKIKALKDGETLHLINPDSVRDIMDAESVIDAILYVAERKFNGVINIGSGVGMSVNQIAELLVERLNRRLLITGENKTEPNSLVADITELQKIIKSVIC